MRGILTLSFFILFISGAVAQFEPMISPGDTARMYGSWEKGKRTGEWISQHQNENIRWIGSYKKGKPDGEWRYFFALGQPDKICVFEDGNLKSIVRFPNLDKDLRKVEIEIDSVVGERLSAEFLHHDRHLGQIMHQMIVRDLGDENLDQNPKVLLEYIGPSLIYSGPASLVDYSDYKFDKAVQYIDSMRTSHSIDYWLTRSIKFSYLTTDRLERKIEKMTIDRDGYLRFTKWTYYTDEPQKIYEKLVYVDGILREAYFSYRDEGNYQVEFYWKTGEIHHTGRYKEGVKHGRWEYYDMQGKLMKIEHYRMGGIKD